MAEKASSRIASLRDSFLEIVHSDDATKIRMSISSFGVSVCLASPGDAATFRKDAMAYCLRKRDLNSGVCRVTHDREDDHVRLVFNDKCNDHMYSLFEDIIDIEQRVNIVKASIYDLKILARVDVGDVKPFDQMLAIIPSREENDLGIDCSMSLFCRIHTTTITLSAYGDLTLSTRGAYDIELFRVLVKNAAGVCT